MGTLSGGLTIRRRFVALAATLTLGLGAVGATLAGANGEVPGSSTTTTAPAPSTTTSTTTASAPTTTTTPSGAGSADAGSATTDAAAAAVSDALDLGAAAVADSVTVRTTTHAGDPAGSFTIRLQTCTGSAGLFGPCRTNGSWADVATTVLAHGEDHTFTGLGAATNKRYRVVEDDTAGWVLAGVSGASCTGGGSTTPSGTAGGYDFGVWVGGADKDCTFDNANRRVTITKAADAPAAFTIQLQRCSANFLLLCTAWADIAGGPGTWTDGTTFEFTSLPSAKLGVYRAIETLQEGWRLTDLTCSGGPTAADLSGLVSSPPFFGHFFFLTGANPTRSCTFTNDANRITVTKATTPTGAPREFPTRIYMCKVNILTACVGGDDVTDATVWDEIESFDLVDGGTHDLLHPEATLFDRLYAVVEDAPGAGWTVDVDCTGNLGIGSPVDLPEGQKFTFSVINLSAASATCTIGNSTTTGSITVEKSSSPVGGAGFGFELTDLDDPAGTSTAFSLDDAGDQVFSGLFPSAAAGGYRITETSLPPTWSLDGVDCGAASTTPVTDGIVVALAAGESVTCTFENSSSAVPGIAITKTPSTSVAQPGDTITYTYRIRNTGPVPVSGLTVVDDPLGAVPLDLTTLSAAGTPGDTATGTLTRAVTDADVGQVIVNSAVARGLVACDPGVQVCSTASAVTAVTASTTTSVSVLGIAGASVLRSSAGGSLASTGSSPTAGIVALVLIASGALLAGTSRSRRRGLEA